MAKTRLPFEARQLKQSDWRQLQMWCKRHQQAEKMMRRDHEAIRFKILIQACKYIEAVLDDYDGVAP